MKRVLKLPAFFLSNLILVGCSYYGSSSDESSERTSTSIAIGGNFVQTNDDSWPISIKEVNEMVPMHTVTVIGSFRVPTDYKITDAEGLETFLNGEKTTLPYLRSQGKENDPYSYVVSDSQHTSWEVTSNAYHLTFDYSVSIDVSPLKENNIRVEDSILVFNQPFNVFHDFNADNSGPASVRGYTLG